MVTISEPVRLRLYALYQEQTALRQRFEEMLAVTLEAMGVEGKATNLDIDTGVVTLEPPDIPMNRAQRKRRKAQAGAPLSLVAETGTTAETS